MDIGGISVMRKRGSYMKRTLLYVLAKDVGVNKLNLHVQLQRDMA